MHKIWWVVAAAFAISVMLTGVMRRIALAKGIIDKPNERSSHSTPIPRGGGLAIVAATALLISTLAWLTVVDARLAFAVIAGGLSIAWVGFIDDRGAASVGLRFGVHLVAAIVAVCVLGGLPPLQFGHSLVDLGWMGDFVAVLAIVWVLNLFNFMDGIDGIAASESVFVTAASALLMVMFGVSNSSVSASLVLGAASFGFLVWNWPPAKIFMGDVGSGFLGYVIAVLALASARHSGVTLFVWLILGGVFFVDATVTLIRRLLRRERIYQAHRSHAYQRLSRRWGEHWKVTVVVWLVNILWLAPNAYWCINSPSLAPAIVGVAYAPLIVLAWRLGAGVSEAG